MNADAIFAQIDKLLKSNNPATLSAALDSILVHFGCSLGTIHCFDPTSQQLKLIVDCGVPDAVRAHIEKIPIGKGMAGLAAQRRECVSVCNLQTDNSGVAKPAAKLTGMEGSIAVPMLVGGEVRGVLGIAKPAAYEFKSAEQDTLLRIAAIIGKTLGT